MKIKPFVNDYLTRLKVILDQVDPNIISDIIDALEQTIEDKSRIYISELPISGSAYDITIFSPSGEKRGAKVIPGKSPTISCCPVSMSKINTLGLFL